MSAASRVVAAALATSLAWPAFAQTAAAPVPPSPPAARAGTMLMTVFLKHDQSKTLDQINADLKRNGYYDQFPPEGVEVDSWYVVMGIGQVVTLRFPPERLREINRILEQTAWGGYRTEFFPAYDYKDAAEQQRRQMRAR